MIVICRPSSFRLVIVSWVNPNLSYLDKNYNKENKKEFKTFADASGFCYGLEKRGMNCFISFISWD